MKRSAVRQLSTSHDTEVLKTFHIFPIPVTKNHLCILHRCYFFFHLTSSPHIDIDNVDFRTAILKEVQR